MVGKPSASAAFWAIWWDIELVIFPAAQTPSRPRAQPAGTDVSKTAGETLGVRVAAAFADGGPLAAALPAFEPRTSQRAMAAAVGDIFTGGGVLLAEAGTGTGKTLAYLVPAILSGRRVLVSTGTLNLQDQIYYKDLPALRDALGVPFTAAYMKAAATTSASSGSKTCCRATSRAAGPTAPTSTPCGRWADQTDTGDRQRWKISRTTIRSGTKSPRRRRIASGRTARAMTTASSRACAGRRSNPTWSS